MGKFLRLAPILAALLLSGCAEQSLAFLSDPAYAELRGPLVERGLSLYAPSFGYRFEAFTLPQGAALGEAYRYLDYAKPGVCFLSPAFAPELDAMAAAYPGTRFVLHEADAYPRASIASMRVEYDAKGAFAALGALMARYLEAWEAERGDRTLAACVFFSRGGSSPGEVEALREAYLAAGGKPEYLVILNVDPKDGFARVKEALFQKNVSIVYADRGGASLELLEQAPWTGALFCLRNSADLAEFREGTGIILQDDFLSGIEQALEGGAAPKKLQIPSLLALTPSGKAFKLGRVGLVDLLREAEKGKSMGAEP